MELAAGLMVGLVALLHLGFMILEMFLWQTDVGARVFQLTKEMADQTATLAHNQGLYNGFLAAGLFWSFFIKNLQFQKSLRIFFLTCIIIAGIFGALTAKPSIFFFQALPALFALIFVWRTKLLRDE